MEFRRSKTKVPVDLVGHFLLKVLLKVLISLIRNNLLTLQSNTSFLATMMEFSPSKIWDVQEVK